MDPSINQRRIWNSNMLLGWIDVMITFHFLTKFYVITYYAPQFVSNSNLSLLCVFAVRLASALNQPTGS